MQPDGQRGDAMRDGRSSLHPTHDHRDRALEHLAADEVAVIDYCADLQADNQALRLLLSVALERLFYAQHSIEGLTRALQAINRDERRRAA